MIVISRTYGIGLRPYNPVEAGSFSAPPLKLPASPGAYDPIIGGSEPGFCGVVGACPYKN